MATALAGPDHRRRTGAAAVAARAAATAPGSAAATGPAGPGRLAWLLSYLALFAAQGLQLAVLHALAPRFFWFDDSQTQFGPTTWWLGVQAQGGRPPLTDPELGMAGNFTADMQYGALEPLHWAWQALAARTDDVLVMAWAFAGLCVLSIGSAVLWLLLHHRLRPALAVPAAVGLATTGFLLWYGSAWWPMLWSVAVLPWVWVGWASRRWPGALVAGVATWAVVGSGNPYVVPFAVLVVLGQLAEAVLRRGSLAALVSSRVVARVVACTGGVALALPTVLATLESTSVVQRQEPDQLVGNSGFAVPNLLDVLGGGMTLLGATSAWAGDLERVPAMAGLVLLPLLALVDWRAALRRPGVPTAALVSLAALVATQLPTTLSLFRYPLRYSVVVQLFLGLLVLLALAGAARVTRTRLLVAGGLLVAQFLLSWSRSPFLVRWHLLALVLAGVGVAAAVLLLLHRRRASGRPVVVGAAVVALVAACAAPPVVGVLMARTVSDRAVSIGAWPEEFSGQPYRELFPGYEQGTTTAAYEQRAYDPGATLTLYKTNAEPDRGWASGLQGGSSNLMAGMRVGTGSYAVWQRALQEHLPRDYQGNLIGGPEQWLAPAGVGGLTWADVAASDTVVVQGADVGGDPELVAHFTDDPAWTLSDERRTPADGWGRNAGHWLEFTRDDGLPGRVTAAEGVQVATDDAVAQPGYSGQVQDAYTVSTPDGPGRLVTRIVDWPGYTATLDGQPVPLSSLDGALLAVDLPAGLDGARLEVRFEPLADRLLVPLSVTGGALLLLGALLPLAWTPLLRRAEGALAVRAGAEPGTGAGVAAAERLLAQVLRFFLGSCLGLTVDLVVFSVMIAAGAPPWLANTVSSACAVVTTYVAVTRYAFGAQASRATFVRFVAWYVVSILAFSALIDGLVWFTDWAPIVAKVATLPLSFAANYLFSRRIFR